MGVRASSTVSAVTQGRADNSNLIATTAFVNQQISGLNSSIPVVTTGGIYNQASLGSGLMLNITATAGVITAINSVTAGGTSYAVGDVLVVPSGNADAIVRVTSVTSGVVQPGGVAIVYGGTGYVSATAAPAVLIPPGQKSISFSGALTSNVTLIIQNGTFLTASRKPWAANNTTGTFTASVFLSNGAGGTTGNGVVLPQGTNNSTGILLYTDGVTDVWPASTLAAISPIRKVTTAVTVNTIDFTILGDTTTAAFTITLPPSASSANRILTFKKVNAGGNALTVKGNGAELIDGTNTITINTQYAFQQIQCDGTQWWTI